MLFTIFILFVGNGWLVPDAKIHDVDLMDQYLLNPQAMLKGDGGYYVLDTSSHVVIFFDLNKLKYVIGDKGQGPGEFSKISAIAYMNRVLYVCQGERGKISLFNDKGTYIKDIKFSKDAKKTFQICDMLVDRNSIYVAYQNGENFLDRFDIEGRLQASYRKKRPDFGLGLGNSYKLKLVDSGAAIRIFSQFTGELFQVTLSDQKTVFLNEVKDPLFQQLLEKFKNTGSGNENILSVSYLLSDLVESSGSLYAPFTHETNKYLLSVTTKDRYQVMTSQMPFKIIDLYQFDRIFFLIDQDGGLHWTTMKWRAVQNPK